MSSLKTWLRKAFTRYLQDTERLHRIVHDESGIQEAATGSRWLFIILSIVCFLGLILMSIFAS